MGGRDAEISWNDNDATPLYRKLEAVVPPLYRCGPRVPPHWPVWAVAAGEQYLLILVQSLRPRGANDRREMP